MQLKRNYIVVLVVACVFSLGFCVPLFIQEEIAVIALNNQKVFEAGTPIELVFEVTSNDSIQLFCHSSYGITIIKPVKKSKNIYFKIPAHIANKRGVLEYQLINKTNTLYQGRFTVIANANTQTQIASYVGPPSILAGGDDYAMLVVSPTDIYDNPLADSTNVEIKHQFRGMEMADEVLSCNFISWKNLFSYKQAGRLLISSEVAKTPSKEFAVEVFPTQAIDFDITIDRKHKYADGNQITTINTSIITDEHGNTVSDGTLVTFVVEDKKGYVLKTQGATIAGIAIGRMLHPDHSELWQIEAYVAGMAKSQKVSVDYEAITHDYEVTFSAGNRRVSVGPLKSFMGQLIPDGATVKLDLVQNDKRITQLIKTSSKGLVEFELPAYLYSSGNYNLKIATFGIVKEFNNVSF